MITTLLFFPEKTFLKSHLIMALAQDVYPVTQDGIQLHGWYFEALSPGCSYVLAWKCQQYSGRLHKSSWLDRRSLFYF
jgi:hypothetical protein